MLSCDRTIEENSRGATKNQKWVIVWLYTEKSENCIYTIPNQYTSAIQENNEDMFLYTELTDMPL